MITLLGIIQSMHAYLLIGKDKNALEKKAGELAKEAGARFLPRPISKIEDVRDLSRFLKLSLAEKTAFFIPEVDRASDETLNALLKNLEEPQDRALFILTAGSKFKVLDTVLSRTTLINVGNQKRETGETKEAEKFLDASFSERLIILEKNKKREEAIFFFETLITGLHKLLLSRGGKLFVAQALKAAQSTLSALKANGNVGLQLTNFAAKLTVLQREG